MSFGFASLATPFGARLCVGADDDGIFFSEFSRAEKATLTKLTALYGAPRKRHAVAGDAARQARAYFARRLRRFDLPLALRGTALQVAAWRLVAATEWGMLVSYADVARAIARPGAHRGVAAAMARSPLALFIPAHRVIGADGRVKGATGREALRRRLLHFEGHRAV